MARFPSNATQATHAKNARNYATNATDAADASDATAKTQGPKRCLFVRCVRCVGWKPGLRVNAAGVCLCVCVYTRRSGRSCKISISDHVARVPSSRCYLASLERSHMCDRINYTKTSR